MVGGWGGTWVFLDSTCLKKTKATTTALDYRPIALLSSDYKIYTRVMATRLQAKIASIISHT